MKFKNISGSPQHITDIGDYLETDEIRDTDDFGIGELASNDLHDLFSTNKCVYIDVVTEEPLTEAANAEQVESVTQGVDLSDYMRRGVLEGIHYTLSNKADNAINTANTADGKAESAIFGLSELDLSLQDVRSSVFTVSGSPTDYATPIVSFDSSTGKGVWIEGYQGTAPDPVYLMNNSYSDDNYPVENLFDDNTATQVWNSNTMPTIITADYGLGKVITNYAIRTYTYPTYKPRKWKFQGSNNDANWTTLDSKDNMNLTSGAAYTEFSFNNTTSYRYYRLRIITSTTPNWINLSDLKFGN